MIPLWPAEHPRAVQKFSRHVTIAVIFTFDPGHPGSKHEGFLVTRPFLIEGHELLIDADTTVGNMSVELLDERFEQIEGMISNPITGNSQVHRVSWPDGRTLKMCAGRPLRMKFHLQRSRIFGFRITE